MPNDFGRSQRVASQMQKELALILQRDVHDPRLGFVTINEVVLSKDLASAKIYITVLNGDERAKQRNVETLNEMAPFIRHELAKRMRLRHISVLHFYYDHSFDTGMRVAELLQEVNNSDSGNGQA
ncbi:30S ribosome-binding factor RbfA [Methylomonas paludis]|uniref:Ribosome-binding factor A n=1 Tax=Methylomonas paludis TaxID=1173101 RepID=A0A975MQQ0_9GAMM|nr:30S ribosome-binding factor RbfA [Methylomonas paludis]QWF72247.1 30S ribosome-binding factor RbfA [Methylomonas paludis]